MSRRSRRARKQSFTGPLAAPLKDENISLHDRVTIEKVRLFLHFLPTSGADLALSIARSFIAVETQRTDLVCILDRGENDRHDGVRRDKLQLLLDHYGIDRDGIDRDARGGGAWQRLAVALATQLVPGFQISRSKARRGSLTDVSLGVRVELLRRSETEAISSTAFGEKFWRKFPECRRRRGKGLVLAHGRFAKSDLVDHVRRASDSDLTTLVALLRESGF